MGRFWQSGGAQAAVQSWSGDAPARRMLMSLVAAGLLAAVGVVLAPAPSAFAASFAVNSTGDAPDDNPGDGSCETATAGQCTLRAAIEEANALGGDDQITFQITGGGLRTITVGTPLQIVSDGVTIDGWSQGVFDGMAGYSGPPLIRIASSTPLCCDGLSISASDVRIVGLSLGGFTNAVTIFSGSDVSLVGSYIGVAPDLSVMNGTTSTPNIQGILVAIADDVTIGGTATGEGNVIAGNLGPAVVVQTAGFTTPVTLLGNYIGTNRLGTPGIGNVAGAAVFTGWVAIGDGTAAGRNVLAGNTNEGINLNVSSVGTVKGNYIGVAPDGATGISNGIGIKAEGAALAEIGGTAPGERNVISGNTQNQVVLTGVCGCAARVVGNYIGPNAAGTAAVTNNANGILVTDALGMIVGGLLPGERNLISGNAKDGITIVGETSEQIAVGGNWIGLNAAGTAALGNGGNGISLVPDPAGGAGPHRTIIGDEVPGTSNVIAGNGRHGIRILRSRQNTTIIHNVIGTDPTGSIAIPNGGDGILIERANRLTVRENTIANNGQAGVVMMPRSGPPVGNVLFGNAIFGNQGLGIDLSDTVDANGNGDGITPPGTPGAQDFPAVLTATTSAAGTVVGGTLTSTPDLSYRVELFGSPSCDPSGNGEGRAFLGGVDVGTNGGGIAQFSATVPALPVGQFITATATNLDRQTSEFSVCKAVTTASIVITPPAGLTTTEAGGQATFTVALSTLPVADVTIGLTSSNPAEGTVSPASLTFTSANGTTPQTVTVTGVADTTADGNKNYSIVTAAATSSDPAYSTMNAADVAVVNVDSATVPTLSVAPAQVTEGTGAPVQMSFTVTLSPASTQAILVPWTAQSGTAQVGIDFVEETGSVTFAPGETSRQIVISVVGDAQAEGDETLTLVIGQVSNAVVGTRTAVGTIKDDDLPVSACSPSRPSISVTSQRSGSEQLLVTIKAGTGTLQRISFGTPTRPMLNATAQLIGSSSTITDLSTFTPPAGTTQMTFMLRRVAPGQPTLIPLVVEDGCGPWETFVGGGNGAF